MVPGVAVSQISVDGSTGAPGSGSGAGASAAAMCCMGVMTGGMCRPRAVFSVGPCYARPGDAQSTPRIRPAAVRRPRPRRGGLEPEPLPDGGGEPGLVHRVEVQAGRALREQAVAEVGDDVEPEAADRGGVVAEALQLEADPARDLGAAGVGEARELAE